ncbi:unnamed protein product [Periconia digitata]|uniref:Zn(2)-C6 fungal-type domain-containing protein n=1 Tax=Periconia digitata TaxID=1303443 RepID=A0A9W4XRF6_9PLEO|nr:unnamed protein product [Periconia digitata]
MDLSINQAPNSKQHIIHTAHGIPKNHPFLFYFLVFHPANEHTAFSGSAVRRSLTSISLELGRNRTCTTPSNMTDTVPDNLDPIPPTKKMRVGTKSCAECRRRKVRCIFQHGKTSCDGCTLHDVVCQPQKGALRRSAKPSQRDVATNDTLEHTLQERIAHLESVIVQMQANRPVTNNTNSINKETETATSNDEVLPDATAETLLDESASDVDDATPGNAPLPRLLQEYRLIAYMPSIAPRTIQSFQIPRPPLPNLAALTSLLDYSEKFWPVWPICIFDVAKLQRLILAQHQFNADTLGSGMSAPDHIAIAKLFLWIALCLTHCPRRRLQSLTLPGTQKELIARYTQYASAILAAFAGKGGGTEEVECLSIQWKIYFDTGKPRQAWLTLRNGIAAAIQLGCHTCKQPDEENKQKLWSILWQNERHVSCMLGLPECTTNDHPGIRLDYLSSIDAVTTIHHKLSIIFGDLINRDQNGSKDDYAITIKIDQDLELLRPLLPDISARADVIQVYIAAVANIRFYVVQMFLHMPYLLQDPAPSLTSYSVRRTLDASRQIIHNVSFFREVCDEYMCEVLDFQLFSAAMLLILGLLFNRQKSNEIPTLVSDESPDWEQIDTSLKCLHRTNKILGCTVAKQGAETLQAVIAVCHPEGHQAPQSSFPNDPLVVTIPYFGRVKINYPAPHHEPSISSSSSYPSLLFSPTLASLPTHSVSEFPDELGVNWFQQFDTTDDIQYGFPQEYQFFP